MLRVVHGHLEGKDKVPTYANRGGDSNVASYEDGPGWIEVTFMDFSTYRYDDRSAGAASILTMQQLAQDGHGLNAYINTHVKMKYASKVR